MGWFEKGRSDVDGSKKKTLGEGVFRLCPGCSETKLEQEFTRNLEVCPGCGHHFRLSSAGWLELLVDRGTWKEEHESLSAVDPLSFVDSKTYPERIKAAQKRTGLTDAATVGEAKLDGIDIEFGMFLFEFMGGSMGSVVGEKVTLLFEAALQKKRPAVLLSASGGARMQEGILSLMQMAKSVAALGRLRDAGLPFISILLNPTTGGVAASFSLLGDINIAEPNALIGFAGPRVIEQTIRETLPAGFQSSEFLLEHGMVDIITARADMKKTIATAIRHLHTPGQ